MLVGILSSWPGERLTEQAYNLEAMKNMISGFLLLLFSAFSLAQTTSSATQAAAPAPQQPPRDECAGCTPQQRQAAEVIKQGRELQNQGKLDEAVDSFKKAMAIAP